MALHRELFSPFSATRRAVVAGIAATVLVPAVMAQTQNATSWPAKPVTLVVPFPAGGGTDAFARPLSAQFAKQTGRQLIIDNRGGAGGTLGASIAAKAQPDGYTLFMGAVHHAIAPSIYPKLDYDIDKDFVPLVLVANVPQVLVINPTKMPVTDFKGFLDYLRKNPGKLNYASAGNGTSHHLAGELFKQQSNTFITHIPYRGAGPALQSLIAGDVEMMFDGLGSSANHIKGGRIKALMVSGNKRNPAFPDVPCAGELGFPEYSVTTWYGLWAPKGTPAEVQAQIIDTVKKTMDSDALKTIWANNGSEVSNRTQTQFASFVHSEIIRWAAVVKSSGAKLD
jgi:tripartite-type tricarboxylate transporter receptor subunit TctC